MPNVKDWRKAYDWPTEGENFLVWARYKATNTSNKPAEAKVDIRIDPKAVYPDASGPRRSRRSTARCTAVIP